MVTRPFAFEGRRRSVQAEQGIQRLKEKVDTLIVIPNDRLITVSNDKTSMLNAFKMADEVLLQGVQGITDLITTPGLINTDFADVKMIMSNAGSALMGIGYASGEGRALNAARGAISSPLLEASIEGARGILLTIAGGSDLGLYEVNEAAEVIHGVAHPDANIIFGTVIDDDMGDEVRVTVIAAGFDRWDDKKGARIGGGEPVRSTAVFGDDDGRRRPRPRRRRRLRRPVVPEVALPTIRFAWSSRADGDFGGDLDDAHRSSLAGTGLADAPASVDVAAAGPRRPRRGGRAPRRARAAPRPTRPSRPRRPARWPSARPTARRSC